MYHPPNIQWEIEVETEQSAFSGAYVDQLQASYDVLNSMLSRIKKTYDPLQVCVVHPPPITSGDQQ